MGVVFISNIQINVQHRQKLPIISELLLFHYSYLHLVHKLIASHCQKAVVNETGCEFSTKQAG